jgi:hypothetical protein
LPTSAPPKTLNLTAIQEQKWCYRSDVEVLLHKTRLQRRCWSNVAEAVLKRCYRRHCWNGVIENILPKDN